MCIRDRYEHRPNSEQVLDYPKQQDHMRRFAELCAYINNPVSYTHLDVYKRQLLSPTRLRSVRYRLKAL